TVPISRSPGMAGHPLTRSKPGPTCLPAPGPTSAAQPAEPAQWFPSVAAEVSIAFKANDFHPVRTSLPARKSGRTLTGCLTFPHGSPHGLDLKKHQCLCGSSRVHGSSPPRVSPLVLIRIVILILLLIPIRRKAHLCASFHPPSPLMRPFSMA